MVESLTAASVSNALLTTDPERPALGTPILDAIGGKLQELYRSDLKEAAPDHLAGLLQRLIAVLPPSAPDA